MHRKGLFILILFAFQICEAQTLHRKAFVGLLVSEKNGQVTVDSVIEKSTAFELGIQKKDIIVSVGSAKVNTVKAYYTICAEIMEGQQLQMEYMHNNKKVSASAKAKPKPLFTADWCEVVYGELYAIGCTIRKMIYKPKNKKHTAAVFFIPGYNCGSIEGYSTNFNGKMIEGWVKAGYTVYTVEKSGLGDSKGCKPCAEVDLQTDIELFETAYKDLASLDYIDKNNLFIWGHSMGGIIAPLIAQPGSTKGIMVFGTVFRPWSEFLLEMHRVQKPLLDGLTFEETETFTRLIQKVYYEFFILKKSPAELYQNPEYKKIVETELEYKAGKEDMWGRHWRFWQQLDSINLAKAWQDVNCKVLVFHGEADFIQCSALEPYLIKETVNKAHPGNATLISIPELDHLLMHSKDFPEAAKNTNDKAYLKGNFDDRLLKESIQWMERVRK